MNRIFIIQAILSIGTLSSFYAQTNKFDWGIEGGPNLSFVTIKNNSSFKPNPAIFGSGGFIFQYNTKKILSFKTGFSYQRKGYRFSDITLMDNNNQIQKGRFVSSLDYISLPLLVKASFGEHIKFFVNAGPYGGFLLGRTDKIVTDNQVSKDHDLKGTKRWDFGLASGIGIAIPIKTFWMIHAELRNYSGLLNINSNANTKLFTNTTDLRLGLVYRLGFREE